MTEKRRKLYLLLAVLKSQAMSTEQYSNAIVDSLRVEDIGILNLHPGYNLSRSSTLLTKLISLDFVNRWQYSTV
jgi:hypothetical protein